MQTIKQFIWFASALALAGCVSRPLDYTRHESNVCEVHNLVMTKKMVPAYHGMFPLDQETQARLAVANHLFPHAVESVNPDCDIRGPKSAIVYSCPDCERAWAQWEASYNAQHPSSER